MNIKNKNMKFRILFLSVCAVAVAVTSWYAFERELQSEEVAYVPRSEKNSAAIASGQFEYLKSIKSNIYTGEIEQEDVVNMRSAVRRQDRLGQAKNDDVEWAFMGPSNVGGRTRAIQVYEGQPNRLLAGGISGGLFRSEDGGQNWELLTGFSENLGVSSIAILGNGSIYVGTGHKREGFANGTGGSEFIGGGLFVSNDDGNTFSLVSDFEPTAWDVDSDWAVTNKLIADPNDDDKLWVGTNFGLYPYMHGDEELGELPEGLIGQEVQDFDISTDGQNIFVGLGPRVYVSTDGGSNFEQVNNGPFSISGNSTMDLSISPADKDVMYASVSTGSGYLKSIYATTDAGQTWNVIAPASSTAFAPFSVASQGQGNYDNMISAVPTTGEDDDYTVLMGGIRLYRWQSPSNVTPGISLWEPINDNFSSAPGLAPSPIYVHSDIHTAEWDGNGTVYIGSDGGIFKSSTIGSTWSEVNNQYSTTQFYAIAFSPFGQVLGGLQDNGSLWLSLNGSQATDAIQFSGGDGFDCEISQEFPSYMFSTLYNGVVYRSTDGGTNVALLGNLSDVSNGGGGDFYTDIALHENINNSHSEIFIEYSPQLDDPYVDFFDEGEYELTANGDTIIGKIPAGTSLLIDSDNTDLLISYVNDEDINYYSYFVRTIEGEEFIYHNVADTAFVQEKPQYMMAAALSNGVYVTRQPMKTNGVPQWYRISTGESSNPTSVEFSPDGDHLYVGYGSGQLMRYSGLNDAWTELELTYDEDEFALTKTMIHNGAGAVTDIEVDYSQGQGTAEGADPASERVAISVGNYGGSGKVRVSDNGASAAGVGSFDDIWNVDSDILGMPCYSIIMDVNQPEVIMVGTEHGVYYTGNNGDSWSVVNNGDMVRVPVFDLRQQKRKPWQVENSGVVYAGTHGRGVFKTDYLLDPTTSVDDIDGDVAQVSDLVVFPNPLRNEGTLEFDLASSSQVNVRIFSLEGRLVASTTQRIEAGADRQVRFNTSELGTGTYIVQVESNSASITTKFVKSE